MFFKKTSTHGICKDLQRFMVFLPARLFDSAFITRYKLKRIKYC